MYGARQSLHSSSSLVLAKPNTTDTGAIPGFVTKYVVVDAILNLDATRTQKKVHLAFGSVNMSIDIGFVTQLKCGVAFLFLWDHHVSSQCQIFYVDVIPH